MLHPFLSSALIIDFEVSEYTVVEDESVVMLCLRTNHGNDEPVTVIIHSINVATSGKLVG